MIDLINSVKIKILDNYTVGKNHYGKAVFAAKNYKKDDVIVVFEGPIVGKKDLPKNLHGKRDRYVQVGLGEYMGPSRTTDDYINHSCDPNSGLKFTDFGILLIAIKAIKVGEEITWDYSTTMHDDNWTMDCLCGSKKCRKVIKEFRNLPTPLKKKYKKLGILPKYNADLVPIHSPIQKAKIEKKPSIM